MNRSTPVQHRPGTARCSYRWERRTPGKRYVNARGQCVRWTAHPTGRCSEHRYTWMGVDWAKGDA